MRFSTYSILSERMKNGGYVLMNTMSGGASVVSDPLGQKIERFIANRSMEAERELVESIGNETRRSFLDAGHLTEVLPEAEQEIVVNLAMAMHDEMVRRPHFMIVPNLDCNYRCTYCFERPLQNGLKSTSADISHQRGNVVMMNAHVDAIYTAISAIRENIDPSVGRMIILYGGEPLDKVNKEVVHRIVETGIARGHFFAAVTNGHDLEHYIDLLGTGKIEQIQISIDGLKDVHDRRRVYVGKESSFDKLVENINLALANTDAMIQIRVHVDPTNIAQFEELVNFFGEQGWLTNDHAVIYANTVYEKDASGKIATGLDQMDIVRQISDVCRRSPNIHTSAPAAHTMSIIDPIFERGARAQLRGSYCSANSANYIFAPDWSIYSCWESIGKACSKIGRYGIGGGLEFDDAAVKKWFNRSIATLPSCQTCSYALVCGGGCAQYAEYETGDLYTSYCDGYQGMFRAALAERSEFFLNQIDKVQDAAD